MLPTDIMSVKASIATNNLSIGTPFVYYSASFMLMQHYE